VFIKLHHKKLKTW